MSENMNMITARDPDIVAAEINTIKKSVQQVMIAGALEIGGKLVEAKGMVPHGQWGEWLANKVNYSQSTANNLMKLYQEYGGDQQSFFDTWTNSQTFAELTYTQHLALLALPFSDRQEFAETHQVAEMSTRELEKKIREELSGQFAEQITAAEQRAADAEERADDAIAELEDVRENNEHVRSIARKAAAKADEYLQQKQAAEKALVKAEKERENAEKSEKNALNLVKKLEKQLADAKSSEQAARNELQMAKDNPDIPDDVMAAMRQEAEREVAQKATADLKSQLEAAQQALANAERDKKAADEAAMMAAAKLEEIQKVSKLADPDMMAIQTLAESMMVTWNTIQGHRMKAVAANPDNPNWTQTNKTFKFIFGGGAITAMDGWAASTLWPWAENKVRREHPELEIGSKVDVEAGNSPFYKRVAEEFNNAVSRSQSVSDEIHQGRLRKSKNPIARAFTMFRSDSAQTYNTLRQKIGEAQFYARTGAKDKVLRTAKKAVGTAFMALLVNALWGEAINFLMALWKNKAKNYRDDEEELTAESVAGEMVSGMMGSFSGVVTGGEEVLEIIGNILTGEKLYDIETPGMEQLNDVIETISTAGGNMRELVAGGWDIVKNGGDLGAYFGEHSGQILGSIKDLAVTAATYLPGFPATNLEAYLIGTLKWVSPELGTAFDDLFEDVGKSDLSGMEGGALVSRIGGILSDRRISESDDTAEILAALYEEGYREAMPGDVPTSISVNGEDRKLGVYQQQSYSIIWGSIVSGALDSLVTSDSFAEADDKTRAKMLNNLYSYAAELARAELFEDYEIETGAAENAAIIAAGASVAECIAWNTVTSGNNSDGTAKMKSGEKAVELASWDLPYEAKREIFRTKISDSEEDSIDAFLNAGMSFEQFLQAYGKYSEINGMDMTAGMKAVEIASWDLPYEAKREIFRTKISDSREDSIDAFLNVGMSFDQFLQAYGKYSEINGMDMTASMKAVEFSHWTNDQGYTAEQANVAKDQLTYFNMTPASASRYDGFVGAGLDATDAYNLTGTLDELEPEEGQETVSDLQKWRASVDFSDDVEKQLTALSIVMSDSQYMKVEIANDFGVSPDAYITLQEIKPRFDADGNGSYKQTEIQAAIDSMSGRYTTEQKAVLWQLTTGSTSSKNNPYSRQVGQRVLDARAEAKERAASQDEAESGGEYEDYSFSQAILDQWLNGG